MMQNAISPSNVYLHNVDVWNMTGYWGYGNEYQKDDNLEAYKAVVGNGISFIDTSEVSRI